MRLAAALLLVVLVLADCETPEPPRPLPPPPRPAGGAVGGPAGATADAGPVADVVEPPAPKTAQRPMPVPPDLVNWPPVYASPEEEAQARAEAEESAARREALSIFRKYVTSSFSGIASGRITEKADWERMEAPLERFPALRRYRLDPPFEWEPERRFGRY